MNVGQLKKELEKYPDTMDVFLAERLTDFDNGLLNSVRQITIRFCEDNDYTDDEPYADDECVVLSED